MIRALFETFSLFLSPFLLFALYLALRMKFPLAVEHWTHGRLLWLSVVGGILAAAGLVYLDVNAERGQGVYIPAHMEHGALVQGHFE